MLRVIVRFEKENSKKTIRLQGFAHNYPVQGVEYGFFMFQEKHKILINLGKVVNTKSCGDMTLVQTDLTVAEVWFIAGEVDEENEPAFEKQVPTLRLVKKEKSLC